ncbi:MAG: SDR family NAD(P)-dependent oxidoreductase [Thermoleophilaceae bacterium]|nr:SDR family NAD(P)-dependent oxidoreductase [Thermoleophilaceae bacterium]
MSFSGKRILLTGAAGGLGEITAAAFAEAGATLILSSRNEEKLNEIVAGLPGGPHEVIAADLMQPGAPEDVVARAGRVDILVANAGRPGGWALDETPADEIASVIRVNFEAPIQMVKAVIPQMKERKDGQIVLIASLAGKFALPDSTMYSSTKSGLRAFGWALRPELARDNIAVTVVTPSFIGEVGMFAKRKRKAPPMAGIVSPDKYTKTLLAGVEKGRGEVTIATPQLRVLSQLSVLAPRIFDFAFRRSAPQRKPVDQ